MAEKEARYLRRDPRGLAISLLLPVVLLVLYGYAINFDVKQIRLAVYDPDRTQASRDLVRSLTRTGYFRLVAMLPDSADADGVLQSEAAKVVILLPQGFGADLAAGRSTSVQSLINGSDSLTASIALSYLESMIQDWQQRRARAQMPRGALAAPLEVQARVWYNEELTTVNFVIPGLVVIILMMLAALLTSQTVVRERELGTIEGLVVSPLAPAEVIGGKLLPYVAVAMADVTLVGVAGCCLFHVPLRGDPLVLLALTVVYIFAALGTGMLISVMAQSQQGAYTVALVATLLPTMLLTGFIFPVSSMPYVLQMLVQLHPATHFMVIVRAIGIKGVGLHVLWPRALALIALAAALMAASFAKFKKTL